MRHDVLILVILCFIRRFWLHLQEAIIYLLLIVIGSLSTLGRFRTFIGNQWLIFQLCNNFLEMVNTLLQCVSVILAVSHFTFLAYLYVVAVCNLVLR